MNEYFAIPLQSSDTIVEIRDGVLEAMALASGSRPAKVVLGLGLGLTK